jgi:hypothetical protein
MVTPTRVAAIATAAVLAMTPATALAAKSHHTTAAKTCAALKKKEGAKKFDARFGTGTKHKGAMANCVKQHSKKSSTTTTTKKKKSTSTTG